jgi:hypothetical protein
VWLSRIALGPDNGSRWVLAGACCAWSTSDGDRRRDTGQRGRITSVSHRARPDVCGGESEIQQGCSTTDCRPLGPLGGSSGGHPVAGVAQSAVRRRLRSRLGGWRRVVGRLRRASRASATLDRRTTNERALAVLPTSSWVGLKTSAGAGPDGPSEPPIAHSRLAKPKSRYIMNRNSPYVIKTVAEGTFRLNRQRGGRAERHASRGLASR